MNSSLAAVKLALAFTYSFPKCSVLLLGAFQENFYIEFLDDGSFSDQLLPHIQETMATMDVKNIPYHIHHMVPKLASSFLRHHGNRAAAQKGDFSGSFVEIFSSDALTVPIRWEEPPCFSKNQDVHFEEVATFEKGRRRIFGSLIVCSKKGAKDHREVGEKKELFRYDPALFEGVFLWLPNGVRVREIIKSRYKKQFEKEGLAPVLTEPFRRFLSKKGGGQPGGQGNNLHAFFASTYASLKTAPVGVYEFIEKESERPDQELVPLLAARVYETDRQTFFCSVDQSSQILHSSLQFFKETSTLFGLECMWKFRAPGKKGGAAQKERKLAEKQLNDCLLSLGIDCHKDSSGDFAGPGVEVWWIDRLGRKWKGSTLQFDFFQPEGAVSNSQGERGRKESQVMIRRSCLGSIERSVALMLEVNPELLPFWVNPKQVRVLSLEEKQISQAKNVAEMLQREGFRVDVDFGRGKLAQKLHQAKQEGVFFVVIPQDAELTKDRFAVKCMASGKEKLPDLEQLDKSALIERLRGMENRNV